MTTFVFDKNSDFGGFTVRISNIYPAKTIIIDHCYKKLDSILESLNLSSLREKLATKSFYISDDVSNLTKEDIVTIFEMRLGTLD